MVIFQHYAWKSQPEWLKICFRSLILISILTSYLSYWYMYLPIFNRQNWDTKICSRPTIMPLEIGKSIDHVLYDRIHGLYFYLIISAHCPNCLMWDFVQVFLKCKKTCTKSTVRRDMGQVCSKLISKLMEQYYWRCSVAFIAKFEQFYSKLWSSPFSATTSISFPSGTGEDIQHYIWN